MALEIDVSASVTVSEPKTVTTNKTRIRKTLFDFDETTAIAVVSFGFDDDGDFREVSSELWLLSGEFYTSSISGGMSGTTPAEVLLTSVANVVATIQSTPNLKDSLITSGELVISTGNIYDFLK